MPLDLFRLGVHIWDGMGAEVAFGKRQVAVDLVIHFNL